MIRHRVGGAGGQHATTRWAGLAHADDGSHLGALSELGAVAASVPLSYSGRNRSRVLTMWLTGTFRRLWSNSLSL